MISQKTPRISCTIECHNFNIETQNISLTNECSITKDK
jgi:hypothetical protein